jgi:outer membrane beta-barrel protein
MFGEAAASETSEGAALHEPPPLLHDQDRIKAVPRKALLKRRRWELASMGAVSLNDPYMFHAWAGGALAYYPHDSFGVGLGVDYNVVHLQTSYQDLQRRYNQSLLLDVQQPNVWLHMDLHWVPIHGKIAFFGNRIAHFESYTTLGAGVVSDKFDGKYQPMVMVALGERLSLASWCALRIELRDYVYLAQRHGHVGAASSVQNHVGLFMGVSFFFPSSSLYGAP